MYAHPLAFYDMSDAMKELAAVVARTAADAPLRVLAAIDDGPATIAAAEYARDLVLAHGGEVVLVNVQPAPAATDARRTGERALGPAIALLEASGARWRSEIEFGATAEAILRCARRERCGLIVLGETRRARLARVVRGAVSARVMKGADVPVAIVRRALSATTYMPPAEPPRHAPRPGSVSA